MLRVGFVGLPGSGKSCTARGLAAHCSTIKGFQRIELVTEYAREHIAKYGPISEIADQFLIMHKQIEREDSVPESHTDVLITDSPIHFGFFYTLLLRKHPGSKREAFIVNDIFNTLNMNNYPQRYDFIFYLPPIYPALADGVRTGQHLNQRWRNKSEQDVLSVFRLFPPKALIHVKQKGLKDRIDFCIRQITART